MVDEADPLKDHPVKLYEGWVLYMRSIVNGVGFPIRHVNRFMAVCTKLIIDDYEDADERKKKVLNEKLADAEKELVKEKYLPDLDKEKK